MSETQRGPDPPEEEPLLGQPGDASQVSSPLWKNLILGTGVVAQFGAWILTAIVWGSVFNAPLSLFSLHPLFNSAAALFLIQGILIVQPTHTAQQKKNGTYAHAAFNNFALLTAVAGLVVIEYNKFAHNGTHFVSPHAILGLITYILIGLQAFIGVTQFFVPALYGGVDNAKALYKYHRVGGYVTLVVMLATIAAATKTTFNINVLEIQLWAVIVAALAVLVGIVPRIKLSKLGYLAGK